MQLFLRIAVLCWSGLAGVTALAAEPEAPNRDKALPIKDLQRTTSVDFEKELLPLLKNNCLACHNQTKAKASLVLETPQAIVKGGDSGPAVVPGKSGESLLLKLAAHQEKPVMPPKDNKVNALDFTSEQLGLLKLWIDQGAKGEVRGDAAIVWKELPETVNPIFAIALSGDGQFAACGRGNQLFVYHTPTRRMAARLVDPQVQQGSLYTQGGAAHLDLVHALAFSPDGELLASGGYREVKLWRRHRGRSGLVLTNAPGSDTPVVAASADGKWIATGAADGVIQVWNAKDGSRARTLAGNDKSLTSLRFSPDGAQLVSGATDRSIRLWDCTEGKILGVARAGSAIRAVAWLSKSGSVASAGTSKNIQVWAPGEGGQLKLVKELSGHDDAVTALAVLDGDSERLVSGSADGSLRVWNLETGEAVQKLDHGGPVSSVAARPDGQRLASVGGTNQVKFWATGDGKLIAELRGDRDAQLRTVSAERALAYATSQVGFRKGAIESAEKERKAQLDRVKKSTEASVAAEKAVPEKQKALADAQTAEGAADKVLADTNAELKKLTEDHDSAVAASKKASAEVKSVLEKSIQKELSAQAELIKAEVEKIAAGGWAGAKAVPTAPAESPAANKSGAIPESDASKSSSPATAENATATATSPGPKELVEKALADAVAKAHAAGLAKATFDRVKPEVEKKQKEADEKLKAAKKVSIDADAALKKAELARSTSENEMNLAISAAQRAFDALNEAQGAFQLAETEQKQRETVLAMAKKSLEESEKPVRSVAFSPDNMLLATGGDDGRIHLWSAENGAALDVLAGLKTTRDELAFAGPQRVVSAGSEGSALIWETSSDWRLERIIGTGDDWSPLIDRVNALKFTPDGRRLITGGGEPSRSGELKVWEVADGRLVEDFKNIHSDVVLGLDVTPDGRYLASSAADKFIRVLDLATGKVLRSLEGHTHHVLSVSWKRDGRTLISAGADNVAKVWDAFSGERKKNIDGFGKEVTSITFIGDTDQALAASGDNSVRLVKDNGEKVRSFEGAADFMNAVTATYDGKLVVAGGNDGVLRLWDGNKGEVLACFGPTGNAP